MYSLKIEDQFLYKEGFMELAMASNPVIELELNKSGMLDFEIQPSHPFYERLHKLTTYIDLYNDDDWLWRFRIINTEEDFYKIRRVECEGILSVFYDTVQRPYAHRGSIKDFLNQLLQVHNSQVEEDKKFVLGYTDFLEMEEKDWIDEGYSNSLSVLNNQIINNYGGYFKVQRINNTNYLEYYREYNNISQQEIRFGKNLLDLDYYIKAESIKTAIIPLGSEIKTDDESSAPQRITISKINDGKDYIVDEDGVTRFGYIWDTIIFEEAEDEQTLLNLALEYIKESKNFERTLEVAAIDMHYIDNDIPIILLGSLVPIRSLIHNIEVKMLVAKLQLHLGSPENDVFTLGTVIEDYTSLQNYRNHNIEVQVGEIKNGNTVVIQDNVNHMANLITGANGGYMLTHRNHKGEPEDLFFMDASNDREAKNILRLNKDGISFSNNGIHGVYRNAWTIDGKLVADFIGQGTIKGIRLEENKIFGGMFETQSLGTTNTRNLVNITDGKITFRHGMDKEITMKAADAYTTLGTDPVVGQLNLSSQLSVDGKIETGKDILARQFISTSDARFKKNIRDVEVDWLEQLEIQSYEYIDDSTKTIGLIAQHYINKDFSKYFIVETEDKYMINYQNINNALIKYCQQLNKKIANQEKRLRTLERDIKK